MKVILFLLLGITILVYLAIEFAIPIALFYFIVSHPYKSYPWILLIIWFIVRMAIYIIKETNKNE